MEKTWWWRILTLLIFLGGLTVGYVIFYPYQFGICSSSEGHCMFSAFKKTVAEPLFIFSLISSIVSLFLFFINDNIFLKWLWFALAWVALSALVIVVVPDQQAGLFSFGGPDKETLSIFLGSLFVILSLGKIGWEWKSLDLDSQGIITMKNKLVYIAHPVGGDIKNNVKKILQLCHDIHKKNDAIIPFAPYIVALYYLNDTIVEERELGIRANVEHFKRGTMDEVWLCGEKISEGMKHEIKLAKKYKIPVKVYNPKLETEFESLSKKIC